MNLFPKLHFLSQGEDDNKSDVELGSGPIINGDDYNGSGLVDAQDYNGGSSNSGKTKYTGKLFKTFYSYVIVIFSFCTYFQ